MLLKSLNLINFRQYVGNDNRIEFSTCKDKNVTVILGRNTGGKTTIVQAFSWVLYNEINFPDKVLLNMQVQDQMEIGQKETVEVEIELIHADTHYTISRRQEYVCNAQGNIRTNGAAVMKTTYINEGGQTKILPDFEINDILPEALSDYFFFDGERIGGISQKRGVTQAVRTLMGLNVLSAARDHLYHNTRTTTVVGFLEKDYTHSETHKSNKTTKALEDAVAKIKDIEEQIENTDVEIEFYEEKLEEKQKILRENKDTARLQKEKERIEKHILPSRKNDLTFSENEVVAKFNNKGFAFFIKPLADKALKVLENHNEKIDGIPEMHGLAIDHMIRRGLCICGCELARGSEAYNNVLKEKQLLPPYSIGTIVREFKNKTNDAISSNRTYYNGIVNTYENIVKYNKEIWELEENLKKISYKIEKTDDMAIIENQEKSLQTKIKALNNKKLILAGDKGRAEKTIEDAKKVLDSLVLTSEKNKKISEQIAYAMEVYKWFDETYSEKEVEIKTKLTEKVNIIFNQMYHGKRKVEIDDQYNVKLITYDGDRDFKSDESRGLETVKNFAFIGGLVDLAREKVSSDIEVLSSEPYPLVMDAPFSNADEIHVQNISKALPKVAEQVIMVVMEKDWGFAEKTMGNRVGRKYMLNKQSEILTNIEAVSVNV